MKNKRFCVLQITPAQPNPTHLSLFSNKEDSDFYFVTHDEPHPSALKYCPNTVWSETRNILYEEVPKLYDYYAFIDHDLELESLSKLGIYEQLLEDLSLNPAVLTFYSGRGISTPYASNQDFLNSRKYSCIPFTHNGIKIIHHSLLDWFFPLFTEFRVDYDACHIFNLKEIPFLDDIVVSHSLLHHNSESRGHQSYYADGNTAYNKMHEAWRKLSAALTNDAVPSFVRDAADSMVIKKYFVDQFHIKDLSPAPKPPDINYWDQNRVSKIFDLSHPFFSNK